MGPAVPCPVVPVVAAAMSTITATPTAVPSCAAVLMIPDAVLRQVVATSVPSVVAATDDRPMPSPATPTQTGNSQSLRAAIASARRQPR